MLQAPQCPLPGLQLDPWLQWHEGPRAMGPGWLEQPRHAGKILEESCVCARPCARERHTTHTRGTGARTRQSSQTSPPAGNNTGALRTTTSDQGQESQEAGTIAVSPVTTQLTTSQLWHREGTQVVQGSPGGETKLGVPGSQGD